MRRNHLFQLALSFYVVAGFFACSKSYNSKGVIVSQAQLFSQLKSTPQTFSVRAGKDTVIAGAEGTSVHFYTNSFKDAGGNIITSGSVSVQLVEMYKPGEMIANGATTCTADGLPLQSGGQINITATMNGQQVYANNYGLGFKQTAPSTAPMQLFLGGTGIAGSSPQWTMSDTSRGGVVANGTNSDTTMTNPHASLMYIFDTCSTFNFVNCDHFMGSSYTLTDVTVTMQDNTYNGSNTTIYLVLPSVNCVMQGSGNNTDGTFTVRNVPVGLNYKVVALSAKTGSFYFGLSSGTVATASGVTMTVASSTLDGVISGLQGL